MDIYPNPADSQTQVSYGLSKLMNVSLDLYNIQGQHKANLIADQRKEKGLYQIEVDLKSYKAGVYILKLASNDVEKIRKLTLVK